MEQTPTPTCHACGETIADAISDWDGICATCYADVGKHIADEIDQHEETNHPEAGVSARNARA